MIICTRFYGIADHSVMLSKLALGGYIVLFISLHTPVCEGLCSDIPVLWLSIQNTLVSLQLFLLYGHSNGSIAKITLKVFPFLVSPRRIYKSLQSPFFGLVILYRNLQRLNWIHHHYAFIKYCSLVNVCISLNCVFWVQGFDIPQTCVGPLHIYWNFHQMMGSGIMKALGVWES